MSKSTSETFYNLLEYTVTKHSYPQDLGSVSTNGSEHRVVFFINVQGGGMTVNNPTQTTIDLPLSRYKNAAGRTLDNVATATNSVSSFIGSDALIKLTTPKRRLKTAISLYVPESLIKAYSVDWGVENGDSLMMQGAAAELIGGGNTPKGAMSADSKSNGSTGRVDTALGVAGALALGKSRYAQKALGVAPGNSKAEMLFNQVDFNSFTFDYKFAPRNESEAANVLNIIRQFRHHMLPEYTDATEYLYIYPSEFEIRYYNGAKENEFLENHMTAVLTSVNINYTPQGQFMTFGNGMPTHINLTLNFRELAVPTKESSPPNASGA